MTNNSLLSCLVGNTPMLKITDKIWAKAEFMNPSGSIKDRMAVNIINHAEKNNLLKKGDTIVEATSGNAGISLAWLASERGYKIKIIMPSNMSQERKQILKFYGAELIEVDAGDFDGAIKLRNKLSLENNWFNTNQFDNQLNIEAHYLNTSIEIINQTSEQKLEAFISGTGTGGTIMGCQKRFSESLKGVKIIAVEPSESPVMSGGCPGLHGIQGIGDGSKFLVDLKLVDKIYTVSTSDSICRAKRLASENGLFVGISSGANLIAAEKFVEEFNPEGVVVTILCDRGDRYLTCF
jgi:cysteine synthase A